MHEEEIKGKSSTKVCKYCQSEISKKAKICPNCRKKQGGGCGTALFLGLLAFIFVPFIIGSSVEDEPTKTGTVNQTTQTNSPQEQTAEKKSIFDIGDIVEIEDTKMTLISAGVYTSDNQFLQPKEGHNFYYIEMEVENIGNSDVTISSMMDFNCYADDYSVNQSWMGDNSLDATLSSGKKLKGYIYFEVPIEAQEIILEYKPNSFLDDKVVFKVK